MKRLFKWFVDWRHNKIPLIFFPEEDAWGVTVDVDYPLRVGAVEVCKLDQPEVNLPNVKLKRLQYPLELAVAKTIHDVQGFTAQHIA